MSFEAAVRLENISKCYRLYRTPQDRLKQFFIGRFRRCFEEFWALRAVSLTIPRGECLGILGRNGAGKSTLLQIISGIMTPTSGSVAITGRVAALLELGTGFNTEFNGHDNVVLNASLLGLSDAEIDERYDAIIDFADIGAFIDQPVKTYSSGMMMRLAFAVAIHVDPDILIIDEALSVGDAKFQAKCFKKFEELRAANKTIIFVSHSVEQVVRHCDRAILIDRGEMVGEGQPQEIANQYLSLLFDMKPLEKESVQSAEAEAAIEGGVQGDDDVLSRFIYSTEEDDKLPLRPGYNKAEYRWGNSEAEILDCLIATEQQCFTNHFEAHEQVSLFLKVKFHREVRRPIFGLTIKTPDGVTIFGTNSRETSGGTDVPAPQRPGLVTARFSLSPTLAAGHYLLSIGVVDETADDVIPLDRRYDAIEIYISNARKFYGIADLPATFELINPSTEARQTVTETFDASRRSAQN